jgi:hypothetical protein
MVKGGIPRRRGRLKRFFTQATPYDIGLAFVAVVPGAVGAAKYFEEQKLLPGWLCLAATAVGFTIAFLKHFILWRSTPDEQPPHDLAGCLHLLQAVLQEGQASDKACLRLTIHVPVPPGTHLEQVLGYIGHDRARGQTAGRTFPIECGIIGKAFREKKACVARRKDDNYENYVKELVEEWGYSEKAARDLNPSSMAWMAVPLFNHRDAKIVEGIVYIDAIDRDFFTEARKTVVFLACGGIATFVAKRYN